MQPRSFHIGTIAFSAGNKVTLPITRDGVLYQFNLRLRFTVTAGSSAMVGARFQALARLLKRVDFNIQGRDTVFSQSGAMLAARAAYEFGTTPAGMGDTFVLSGSSTATNYDVTIPIPRFLPRSTRPLLCSDDLRRVSEATLEVTFGDIADLVNTTNSAVVSNCTVDVEGVYLLGVDPAAQFNVRELSEIEQAYDAASDNLGITIDNKTGLLVRSIAAALTDDYVGSNALLNVLTIQAGTPNVFHRNRAGALRGANKADFALENLITGFYMRPLTAFGDPMSGIDTGSLTADLKAIFDVTTGSGQERINLGVEAIRPLLI